MLNMLSFLQIAQQSQWPGPDRISTSFFVWRCQWSDWHLIPSDFSFQHKSHVCLVWVWRCWNNVKIFRADGGLWGPNGLRALYSTLKRDRVGLRDVLFLSLEQILCNWWNDTKAGSQHAAIYQCPLAADILLGIMPGSDRSSTITDNLTTPYLQTELHTLQTPYIFVL